MAATKPLTPDFTEKLLGALCLAMLAAVVAAIGRGQAEWLMIPGIIWFHLATICITLALTPAILWYPRGTRRHRLFGYGWVTALGAAALGSFWIRTSSGQLSVIHILSAYTLCALVFIVFAARQHNHSRHRVAVRSIVIGALLIAGFFTFAFNRLMGTWLFG